MHFISIHDWTRLNGSRPECWNLSTEKKDSGEILQTKLPEYWKWKSPKKEKAKNVITKLSILFPNFLSPFINLSAVYVIKGSEVTFINGSQDKNCSLFNKIDDIANLRYYTFRENQDFWRFLRTPGIAIIGPTITLYYRDM